MLRSLVGSEMCIRDRDCSKLGRWRKHSEWRCNFHNPNQTDENNNPPDPPIQQPHPQTGLPCEVCKGIFRATHKHIKCHVSGCSKYTHTGERCSKIKKGTKNKIWTCNEHSEQDDLRTNSDPVIFEVGTKCPCKVVIKHNTNPVRCSG